MTASLYQCWLMPPVYPVAARGTRLAGRRRGQALHMAERKDDSLRTVVLALIVNLVVAAIKAVAGVLSASAGLLAEAAHSVADSTTELFLVAAVRRGDKPADRRHPFGYGKERYFWS